MNLSIDGEMQKFVDDKVASGEYASAKDVLMAALAALQLQEAYGGFEPGELNDLIAEGEQSINERGTVASKDMFTRLRSRGTGGATTP